MIVGYALAFVVVLAFSIYPSIAPLGLQEGASPFGFVVLAMLVSTLGVVLLTHYRGEGVIPDRREVFSFALLSFLFLMEHLCLLFALQSLKVPVAMSLIYTYPFIIALVSVRAGTYPMSGNLFIALSVCLAGVVLVLGFSPEQISIAGISFALLQAILAAARILLTSRIITNTSGTLLTARMLVGALLLALPFCAFFSFATPQSSLGWGAVGVAGLSGVIGHTCLALSLERIEAVPFGVVMNLEPIFAAVFSALIVEHVLVPSQYLGCFLVVLAVCWHTFLKVRRRNA